MCEREDLKELCALAVAGQISDEDWKILHSHLSICGDCADFLGQLGQISVDLLQRGGPDRACFQATQMRSRFVARATSEGANFTTAVRKEPAKPRVHSLSAFAFSKPAIGMATVGLFGIGLLLFFGPKYSHQYRHSTDQAITAAPIRPQSQIYGTSPQLENRQRFLRTKALESERDALKSQLDAAIKRSRKMEALVDENNLRIGQQAEVIKSLREEAKAQASEMARVQDLLEKTKAHESEQEATLVAQQNDLKNLNSAMRLQQASFEREKVMLAVGKEGENIVAARNLHIVDVYDANGRGKRQRAFGRVFYIEGQELLFYAYDLSDRRHTNAHFYAWGSDGSKSGFVAKLGILNNDGKGEGRWVMRLENPDVLSKIDSIFVTAESDSNQQKPHGERLLYAVLSGQPNHP